MTTILITGVTGFAGSNMVRYFDALNDIRVLEHSRDRARALKQFKDSHSDFIDEISAEEISKRKVDVIIHIAVIAHDLSNQFGPEDYYRVNDKGTRKIYHEFLQSSAKKFIYLSSIKAVADVARKPVSEDASPSPATHYGISKQLAEAYIQELSGNIDKQYYILRPCMIHGPGNKGNLNLLYKYVRLGLPFPLGSFDNKRSFLNVDNFNFIIENLIRNNIPSGIYHLADSGCLSTAELVRTIGKALNRRVMVWNIPKTWIKVLFTITRRRPMLDKLTENMLVSNQKLLKEIKRELPVPIDKGIINTIQSFARDGK